MVVQVAGTLGAGADLDGLRASVGRPRGPGVRAVLFDLKQVTRLDVSGIGELLKLRRQVHSCGLAFGLLNIDARQRRLLDLAGLTTLLGVFDGVADALSSLPAGTAGAMRCHSAPRGLMRFSAARGGFGVGRGSGTAML